MLFTIVSVGVPLLVYIVAPKLLRAGREWKWLLFAACVLFFISWYLPSPLIDGKQTQFMTHFIGGGVFTGLLWLYSKLVKKWRAAWWLEAASLFALVSALGVANELFEFVLFKLGHMPLGISDTSYDLVANTLGALSLYLVYIVVRRTQQVSGRAD
jgi:hypothetical protein